MALMATGSTARWRMVLTRPLVEGTSKRRYRRVVHHSRSPAEGVREDRQVGFGEGTGALSYQRIAWLRSRGSSLPSRRN